MKRGVKAKPVSATTSLRFVKKVGEHVSLFLNHVSARYYYGVWNGQRKRMDIKSLKTKSLKDAGDMARVIDLQLQGIQRSLIPFLTPNMVQHHETIDQALEIGVASLDIMPRSRELMKYHCKYFKDWMAKEFPSNRLWVEITPQHVEAYARYLQRHGNKPNTAIKYMHPIRAASVAMHKKNPALYPKLSTVPFVEKQKRAPLKFLSLEQALKLYHYTAERCGSRYPMWRKAHLMVGLGCFLGLRPSEMARLSMDDVDTVNKVLTIRDSKTDSGARVIPMTDLAVDAWTRFVQSRKVRPVYNTDPVIHHDYLILGRFLRQVLRKATVELNDPDYARCAPHEAMRKTFCALLDQADVPDKYQDACVGHAPATMRREHYSNVACDPNDLEHVKRNKIEQLRLKAIEPVNELIKKSAILSEKDAFPPCVNQKHLAMTASDG